MTARDPHVPASTGRARATREQIEKMSNSVCQFGDEIIATTWAGPRERWISVGRDLYEFSGPAPSLSNGEHGE